MDPFVQVEGRDLRATPGQWLEWRFAAPMPEGGSAIYDYETERLTVTHEKNVLKLMETLLPHDSGLVSSIQVRLEIFEVPALLALRLEESAEDGFDHRPEWEKLCELMTEFRGRKDIRLVEAFDLSCRSEERARMVTGVGVSAFDRYDLDRSTNPPTPIPLFLSRTVGTDLEFDPVLGGDDHTLALNLRFEHHTAAPVVRIEDLSVEGVAEPIPTEVTEFFTVTLRNLVTIQSGEVKLLGSWLPGGDAGAERRNRRQIAFLLAEVHQRSTR